jgi:hypothetical protein
MSVVVAAVCLGPSELQASDFRMQSKEFPIEVVASEPALGNDALVTLEQAFRSFAKQVGVTTWAPARFRFYLRESARGPAGCEIESYPRRVILNPFPFFSATNSGLGFHSEALIRTAMIMQMEAYAGFGTKPSGGELPDPPIWLIEGLTQAAIKENSGKWEPVIQRLGETGRIASLKEIQDWSEISDHRIEQYWQQAQSYWLVKRATLTPTDRERLRLWLDSWFAEKIEPFFESTAETEAWWVESFHKVPRREPIPVLEPENTAKHLAASLRFRARPAGAKVSEVFHVSNLPASTSDFEDLNELKQVAVQLLRVQSTANFVWQHVVERYRFAFSAWLSGRYVDYLRLLGEAEREQKVVENYFQQVGEHLDWFEVNHTLEGKTSSLLEEAGVNLSVEELGRTRRDRIGTKLMVIERGRMEEP